MLDDLDIFLAVAKHMNFTKAAQELHFSQQAVSVRISRLEQNLNCQLFIRDAKGCRLTQQGRHYYLTFRAMEHKKEQMMDEIAGEMWKLSHELVIGCSEWIDPLDEIADTIQVFRNSQPDIKVSILQQSNPELLDSLTSERVDVALFSEGHLPVKPGLTSEPVANEEICLFGPQEVIGRELPEESRWQRSKMDFLVARGYTWSFSEMMHFREQELGIMEIPPRSIRFVPNVASLCSDMAISRACLAISDRRFGRLSHYPWLGYEVVDTGTALYCTYRQLNQNTLVPKFIDCMKTTLRFDESRLKERLSLE